MLARTTQTLSREGWKEISFVCKGTILYLSEGTELGLRTNNGGSNQSYFPWIICLQCSEDNVNSPWKNLKSLAYSCSCFNQNPLFFGAPVDSQELQRLAWSAFCANRCQRVLTSLDPAPANGLAQVGVQLSVGLCWARAPSPAARAAASTQSSRPREWVQRQGGGSWGCMDYQAQRVMHWHVKSRKSSLVAVCSQC